GRRQVPVQNPRRRVHESRACRAGQSVAPKALRRSGLGTISGLPAPAGQQFLPLSQSTSRPTCLPPFPGRPTFGPPPAAKSSLSRLSRVNLGESPTTVP